MGEIAQPAVSGNLEKIGPFPRVRHKYASEKIARVRGDVFGECERCGDDVLVEEVDVVTFRIRWIVIEGKVTG